MRLARQAQQGGRMVVAVATGRNRTSGEGCLSVEAAKTVAWLVSLVEPQGAQ